MAMARASSGLSYPERFYAAAAYAGFDGSPDSSSSVRSKFSSDVSLLLYALYQQATSGPCIVAKPGGWSPMEQSKWKSWNELGSMASTEAIRLFVKILEEEDPGWYSRASNFAPEPVIDAAVDHNETMERLIDNGNNFLDKRVIPAENGNLSDTHDSIVSVESFGVVIVYDQWVAPPLSGPRPKARYEHGAVVIGDKMYIFGGNHNGRYLSDLQIAWQGNQILSIGGHTKDPSETLQVKAFDLQTSCWSNLKTYGKPPISRGGQSASLVGSSIVIFGGQDAKRSLLNDLHILDLETMTWDEIDTLGVPPSPRSDHAAAVYAGCYLLIFGGGSHATCFNDLHVLDLRTMEWSRPTQQGDIPSSRAGHAGVTVEENWFIAGGGDNKSGVSQTVVLNMSTLVWSVVTTVEGRVPLASEGLSLVLSSFNGEDYLVSFGGYNGRYSNEVNVLKPSHKSTLQSKILESPVPDSVSAVHNATNATRYESEFETGQDGKIREITVDSEPTVDQVEESIEKHELESSLSKERLQTLQLKQDLVEAEARNEEIYKKVIAWIMEELQSVRGQLGAEQSRRLKLEVDVAEVRQKLQTMETLQKELELLRRQKAASEQAALDAKQRQSSGGVWGWLAGTPPSQKVEDA